MRFFVAALAIAVAGAGATTTTVVAPCGTSCPTAVPDKSITRTKMMPSETAPCPSVIVSSIGTGSNNTVSTPTPGSPAAFTGGADRVGGSIGVAVAAVAVMLAL